MAWLVSRSSGGQVLLIAVMLMTAILLLGTLFVAIVTYNQRQSARHGDMLLARALAEAGIRYADYMLRHSPLGADWRPPAPPMYDRSLATYQPGFWGTDGQPDTDDDYYLAEEIARGYYGIIDSGTGAIIRVGFTRYPDPTGGGTAGPVLDSETMGEGHVLLRVTYDPDPPFEPVDSSTIPDPFSGYIKIEAVGVVAGRVAVQRPLVAYKPIGLTDYLIWVTDKTNTGKPAYFGVEPWIDFDASGSIDIHGLGGSIDAQGEFLVSYFDGPIRVNTHLELVGGNLSGSPLSGSPLDPEQASNQFILTTTPVPPGGYLRFDRLEVRYGISDPARGVPAGVTVPGQTSAARAQYWSAGTIQVDPGATVWPSDDPSFTTYQGLVLDGGEGMDSTGQARFVKALSAPDLLAPDPATGMDRYRALTRDSGSLVTTPSGETIYSGELGHGEGMYIDNYDEVQFQRSDGSHDLDSLLQDWLQQIPEGDPRAADSGWNALYTLYVPPGVEIDLFDTEAAAMAAAGVTSTTNIVTDPANPPTSPAQMWWPYHQAGEPGIRLIRHDKHWPCVDGTDSGLNVMFIDYPRWPNAVIFAEGNVRIRGVLPPAARNPDGTLRRDYNLTVVSAATIYIDGQILSPQDVDPTIPDEDVSKIALLARDHVCLNTTMIVPQLTSGLVPAAPDDPANPDPDRLHWALAPGAGYLWTRWMFGRPPAGQVQLYVQHSAADPGPSGVGMNIYDTGTGSMEPYDFDPGAATWYVYTLAPVGVPFPGPGSNAIAPTWETAAWRIASYISGNVGVSNALSFFHRDPQLAPGSTDYWVKRFKIQELRNYGTAGSPVWLPIGSIHARVNALIYAERGCWFIIPGSYYDPEATGPAAANFRRYNYEITIRGAITENYTAPPEAVREWAEKCAYPSDWFQQAGSWYPSWGTVRYEYDESLRAGRDQPAGQVLPGDNVRRSAGDPTSPAWNLPRLPVLPVSPSLIYFGQAW